MAGHIYLMREEGGLVSMPEQPYDSEALLQRLLAEHPALLAGEQMTDGSPRRWLLVAREVPLSGDDGSASWYVDHLFLDQDGVPTLVEVKRSTDTRIRREVVGQMLDYAANAVGRWSLEQLRARVASDAASAERLTTFLNGSDPEQFWETVAVNLAGGRIRMVFVADVIPPELRKIVDFLAAQLRSAEVYAVEVRQFQGSGECALVPRLVSAPRSTAGAAGQRQWNEHSFFQELTSRSGIRAEVARHIFNWSRDHMTDFWYGAGSTAGSCSPRVILGARKLVLFAMWTYGNIEFQFQHMRTPPFDKEDRRKELVHRLNAIPGIVVPEDSVHRRPTIDMLLLKEEAPRTRFLEVMTWAIGLFRSAAHSD